MAVESHEAEHSRRSKARGKDKQASFHAAIETIVCNLAALQLDPLNRPLAVPRSNGVMWSGTRYAEPVYGQHFRAALDYLAHPAVGLIEDLGRGRSFRNGTSTPSTVQRGPAFEAFVPTGIVDWSAFRRVPAAEVVVLKSIKDEDDEHALPQDYADTDGRGWPGRWRGEVEAINAWLADASFCLAPDIEGGSATSGAEPIDPTRRPLRRIFTGGEWGAGGGRLYDGFWIDMPKAERFRRLRIGSKAHPEGEPIAVVDFRQFNPRAAYAHANKQPPDGDLYDIRGDSLNRTGFKLLVNAMLSAKHRWRQLPEKVQAALPPGTKARDVIRDVEHHHSAIADKFFVGFGARLAMIESTILIDALLLLRRDGVTALPVHDAVIVARSETVCASDALHAASLSFSPEYGARPVIEFGV